MEEVPVDGTTVVKPTQPLRHTYLQIVNEEHTPVQQLKLCTKEEISKWMPLFDAPGCLIGWDGAALQRQLQFSETLHNYLLYGYKLTDNEADNILRALRKQAAKSFSSPLSSPRRGETSSTNKSPRGSPHRQVSPGRHTPRGPSSSNNSPRTIPRSATDAVAGRPSPPKRVPVKHIFGLPKRDDLNPECLYEIRISPCPDPPDCCSLRVRGGTTTSRHNTYLVLGCPENAPNIDSLLEAWLVCQAFRGKSTVTLLIAEEYRSFDFDLTPFVTSQIYTLLLSKGFPKLEKSSNLVTELQRSSSYVHWISQTKEAVALLTTTIQASDAYSLLHLYMVGYGCIEGFSMGDSTYCIDDRTIERWNTIAQEKCVHVGLIEAYSFGTATISVTSQYFVKVSCPTPIVYNRALSSSAEIIHPGITLLCSMFFLAACTNKWERLMGAYALPTSEARRMNGGGLSMTITTNGNLEILKEVCKPIVNSSSVRKWIATMFAYSCASKYNLQTYSTVA